MLLLHNPLPFNLIAATSRSITIPQLQEAWIHSTLVSGPIISIEFFDCIWRVCDKCRYSDSSINTLAFKVVSFSSLHANALRVNSVNFKPKEH